MKYRKSASDRMTFTIATFVGFTNRGAEALLRTRVDTLKREFPNSKFYVLTIYKDSCHPISDVDYVQTFGGQRELLNSPIYLLKSIGLFVWWSANLISVRLFGTCPSNTIRSIASSNAFISTDGDVLGEDYGLLPYIWRLSYLSIGIFLKKPVIIFSEGVGPFRSSVGKIISRWFFKKCSYISVRDDISREYLQKLDVNVPVVVTADSAFLLPISEKPELNLKKEGMPLVGIAVSKLATQYGFGSREGDPYQEFLNFMGKLIDWMVEEYKANFILIPHVIQVGRDDFETARDILGVVVNKESVSIASRELNASDLKGIISHCDLVIASRMHASIAALSTGVPVVGIAYSHKMKGVFSSLGVSSVVDIQKLDWNITETIIRVLKDAPAIRESLRSKMEGIKKKAEVPARFVAELLSKSN